MRRGGFRLVGVVKAKVVYRLGGLHVFRDRNLIRFTLVDEGDGGPHSGRNKLRLFLCAPGADENVNEQKRKSV